MAKKKPSKKSEKPETNDELEFKPGDTPHYEYDGMVLNANVPWCDVVCELNERGYSNEAIAKYAECSLGVVLEILAKNYDELTFRSGARIITMHCQQFPAQYV